MVEKNQADVLLKRVRCLLLLFVFALVLSGVTAFPLKWEVDILAKTLGRNTSLGRHWPALADWISFVHKGVTETHREYPFLFYGTDWLAFAHIVIAVAFIGPWRDPVKNVWVVQFGIIACVLVIPLALICGPIRGIPLFWRLGDCAFGVVGIVPLWLALRYIRRLERLA
ncbi:MAG TPA: hypothetical protein HPP83_08205 [Candidatus Hydrogenedentes bacterium]|nr:hypothetical protein [Candidatus Hydrogenedentota bacterium]